MRILVCGLNYAPELTGIGKYSTEMAEWLAKSGHDVRVVCAPPYYPEWKIPAGYKSWTYSTQSKNGVKILRCPIYVPLKPTGFTRIIHLVSFFISSFPVILFQYFWKPNAVFSVEPPLAVAPSVLLLSKLSRSKSWMHIQDFEVDAAFELDILSSRWIRRLILWSEKKILGCFDIVSTISRSMLIKLEEKGIGSDHRVFFPNWSNLSDNDHPDSDRYRFRGSLGIANDDFMVLYAGGMGEKQGLDLVLDAAKMLSGQNSVKFVFCGAGPARQSLERRVTHESLGNVLFLQTQSVADFSKLLNAADLHLVVQRSGAADLVMPSKLTNIIASGGYSLVTAEAKTELGILLTENEYLGVLVEPNSVGQFVSAIENLLKNPHTVDHKKIRDFAIANFELDSVMLSFEKKLMSLTLRNREKGS